MSRRNLTTQNTNRVLSIILGVVILLIVIITIAIASSSSNPNIYGESGIYNEPPVIDTPEGEQSENNVSNTTENGKYFTEHGVKFEVVSDTVYTTIILNIRSKPGLDGDILQVAQLDTKISRIGIGENGWDKIKLANGTVAYASGEYLTTKAPKAGTTGAGLYIYESTGVSVSETPVDLTHYTTNTLKDGVTVTQADNFFKDAVFYGDSVTLGFEWYCDEESSDFLGGFKVFGTGSYGIGNALKAVSSSSIHPTYKGYQTQLWDLTFELGVKKVFMMFGMNDIGLYGVEDSIKNYKTLIDKIYEVNPDVKIFILSTTPMCKEYQLKYLNNNNIRKFNNLIRENADSWNVEYIDVASYMVDNNGYLKPNFCSDGKYHLMYVAYDEWVKVLRSYASYNI